MSTHALASLTATYTDSEPEGEEEDEILGDDKKSGSEEEGMEVESRNDYVVPVLKQQPPPKLAKLVSYHDDTMLSDEEGMEDKGEDGGEAGDGKGIQLPPEPSGRCSPRLLEKVTQLHDRLERGLDMNNTIQSRKQFRNPSIYEKLIQFCNLNELGTNYPARMFDPLKWGKESFFEELAKVQKVEMDKREKEKKERAKVEFVSGTKKTNMTSDEEMKKRKSKWDQVGQGGGSTGVMGVLRPAGLLQPSLTSSVTGTKSTVISAFGSLPKKPKI